MEPATGPALWTSTAWRAAATAWLDERLAERGAVRTGPVEQPRVRPWGAVLRAPTSRGDVWLKAPGPGTAFEVGLYGLLHRVVPHHVLEPLAADPGRGWLLLPDGGAQLRQCRAGDAGAAMAGALRQYGLLQRDLAPHAQDLLDLGVADMRPAVMPRRFDEALAAARASVAGSGGAGDRALLERLAAARAAFAARCERLAAAPGGASLDHGDLHDGNVLLGPGDPPSWRFYDWGDAVVAHPFAVVLVPLRVLRHAAGGRSGAPEVLRARDAYLEVFADLAPHAELVAALELACSVAKAARSLTWLRAVRLLGPGDGHPEDWARAPLQWLAGVLAADPLAAGGEAGHTAPPAL